MEREEFPSQGQILLNSSFEDQQGRNDAQQDGDVRQEDRRVQEPRLW